MIGGCADDIVTTTATEPSTTEPTTTTTEPPPTTSLPTTTATEPTTGGESVCEQSYPLPISVFELDSDEPAPETVLPRYCNDEELGLVGTQTDQLDPDLDNFQVFVYRPKVPMGDWPAFKLPYVVFSHGAGQLSATFVDDPDPMEVVNEARYLSMVRAFTSIGFVVFALQLPEWTPAKRARAMGCTALWAFRGWSQKDNERLNCDFVAAGHSQGGEAAYFFAETITGALNDLGFEDRILRGVFALAPRSNADTTASVAGDETLPYLILHGANDADIKNQPTRAFELYGDEESSVLNKHDKFLLWAHGVPHNDWGGKAGGPTEKGAALESVFVPAFFRWQVLMEGDPDDRQLFTDIVHYDRAAVAANLPDELFADAENNSYWEFCCSSEFADLGETPVIFGDFMLGVKNDPASRLQIDTMERGSQVSCMSSVSPASSSQTISVTGFGMGQVCMGSSTNLISMAPMTELPHAATSAMRVQWGAMEPEGSVTWTVDEDVSDYSFLSLRMGQIRHLSPPSMTTVQIGLTTPTGMGSQTFPVDVKFYTQDVQTPFYVTDFMRTIRIPLRDFCIQGADITEVEAVVIEFPPEMDSRSVLIDSIEFVKQTDGSEPGQCP